MPARDSFHDAVRNGLAKEGWTITADPLLVQYGTIEMYVDLGAEKMIAAEKNGEQIAVEIKTFLGPSAISEFHTALGQYLNYRVALAAQEPDRAIYLAVPADVHSSFFQLPFTQAATTQYGLRLIVFDPVEEEIVQWIK